MNDCCTTGTLHEGTPTGTTREIAGLPSYVVGEKNDKVVVMISDVFGYELNNTRLLADEYAKNGFHVILPDFFGGDSLPASIEHQMMPPESAPRRSIFKAVSDTVGGVSKFAPWLYRHREAVSRPIVDRFFTALKQEMSNAKVGAVGFCWGGRYVTLLCHADATVQVDCAVACHPSMLSIPGEIQRVAKPLSIQVGDKDAMMSVKQAEQCREVINQKGIAGEVTIHPGQVHGFACRGDLSVKEVNDGQARCTANTVAWLNKYLSI